MALEAFRATLAGLTAVNIHVEPVNADAERGGLLRTDLEADVAAALRRAGIEVVTQSQLFATVPGTPVLHLDVMTVRLRRGYLYSVRLELWQAVYLMRDRTVQALAVTWCAPQLVGTVSATSVTTIRDTVRTALEEFVRDHHATALEAAPRAS